MENTTTATQVAGNTTHEPPTHYASRSLARMTNGSTRRADLDFYPTPPEATRALLAVERFTGPIWEPACGDGAISKELEAVGHGVVSTDLAHRGYGEGGIDFLLAKDAHGCKTIITNPPYGRGMADRFVLKALTLQRQTGGEVAMLLNLASLCHPSRHAMFIKHPPAAIYALDELVCWPNGNEEEGTKFTSKHRYCWVVWRPAHTGRPSFWWLSVGQFREMGAAPLQQGGR